jgi:hypothetical protein
MQSANVIPGVPNTIANPIETFMETTPYFCERNLQIAGVTRDVNGAPIAACIVKLYDRATDRECALTVSDANGNFVIQIPCGLSQPQTTTWYLRATDPTGLLAGTTTSSTLVGS